MTEFTQEEMNELVGFAAWYKDYLILLEMERAHDMFGKDEERELAELRLRDLAYFERQSAGKGNPAIEAYLAMDPFCPHVA